MISFSPVSEGLEETGEPATRDTMAIQIIRDQAGARVIDGEILLSRVLRRPGPTGTLFDTLAASAACLSDGSPIAVLGFGAGGVVAPLRAMGCDCRITGVDLWADGEVLFRELSGSWSGPVDFSASEACQWLRRRRGRYGLVIEDLSEPHPRLGACKPWASFDELPRLISKRLRPDGAAIFNLLPWPDASWPAILTMVSRPWPEARVIEFEDYENRLLLAANRLETATGLSRKIRSLLKKIGSSLDRRFRVRNLKSI